MKLIWQSYLGNFKSSAHPSPILPDVNQHWNQYRHQATPEDISISKFDTTKKINQHFWMKTDDGYKYSASPYSYTPLTNDPDSQRTNPINIPQCSGNSEYVSDVGPVNANSDSCVSNVCDWSEEHIDCKNPSTPYPIYMAQEYLK